MRITLSDFATVVAAKTNIADDAIISGIAIDSRQVKPGDLFVALSGQKVDGHGYVEQAFAQGAVAAMVERLPESEANGPLVWVEDCVLALSLWAKYHRQAWSGQMCAITGSVGKTTTRSMVQHILESHYGAKAVHATLGNYNNHLGVPLTMAHLCDAHLASVMELGASAVGEIAYLAAMVQPNVAVITCAAPAHLEGFGSLEGVAKGKGELFEALGDQGHAIVALDDDFADFWLKTVGKRAHTTFGFHADADVRVLHHATEGLGMRVEGVCCDQPFSLYLQGFGRHRIHNALAAMAATFVMGVPLATIVEALANIEAVSGRLRQQQSRIEGVSVLNDAYNANPTSFEAALDVLALHDGPKVVAMGGMAELGEGFADYHKKLGESFLAHGVDYVVGLGDGAELSCAVMAERGCFVHDHDALMKHLRPYLTPGTQVLVKGSRSWQMDKVVSALCEEEERS